MRGGNGRGVPRGDTPSVGRGLLCDLSHSEMHDWQIGSKKDNKSQVITIDRRTDFLTFLGVRAGNKQKWGGE